MFTVISTERTQIGKSEKGHYLAKLKLFVLACIYFNTWSMKYRAHLTNFEGTAIFSREIAIAQKASTWNSCRLVLPKMKKKKKNNSNHKNKFCVIPKSHFTGSKFPRSANVCCSWKKNLTDDQKPLVVTPNFFSVCIFTDENFKD